jgi:hypothetical protein
MAEGQQKFGISNLEYDIITTLGNLLEGIDALDTYAADAEQAGDAECATIFRTLRENNRNSAQQLRNALARHLSSGR